MNSSSGSTDRRRFTRIPFLSRVILSTHAGIWHGELVDISLRGLLVCRPLNWTHPAGTTCRLEIVLERNGPSILALGELAHINQEVIGFCFRQMEVQSAVHLRKLIGLNLGDEQLLERELAELINAHLTP